MKTTIHGYAAATRTVCVTFEHEDVTHTRDVNACHDAEADYDQAATEARVAEVATGVAVKIEIGAITNPLEPEAEPAS